MFFFFRGVPVQLEGRPASFQGEHTSAADPERARKILQIPKKSRANQQKSDRNLKEIVKFNPPKPYIFGWLEAIIAPNQSVEALPKPPDAPGYLASTHLGERPEPISRQANKRLETQSKGRAAQQPVPNPIAMALIQKAQTNPKIMKALQDVQTNGPSAMQKYAGNPEVMAVVKELQQERPQLRPQLEVSPPRLEGHVPKQLLPRTSTTAARGPFSYLGGAFLPKPQPMGQSTSSASFHRGPRDMGSKRNEYVGAAPSYIGPDYPAREYHFETPSQRPAYRYSGHDEHLGKAIDHLIRRTELERKAEDAAYRASVAEAWRVEPVIRQPHLHSPCFASPRKQSQPRKERLNGQRREPVDALEHTLTKQQRCLPRRPEAVPMLSIPGPLRRPLSVPLLPLLPLEVPPISSVLESSLATVVPIRDAGWAPGWEPAAPVVAAAAPAPEARSKASKRSAATSPAPQSLPAAFRLRAKRQQQDLQKQGRLQTQGLPRQGLPAAPLRQLVPAALPSPRGSAAPRSLAVGNDERWPGHPSAPTAQSVQACTAAQALAVCTELGLSSPQLASASLARLAALCAGDGFLCAGPSSAEDHLPDRSASSAADAKNPQTPPTPVLESFEGGFEGLLMLLLQLLSTHRQSEPTLAAGCILLVQLMASDRRKEAAVEAGAIGMLVDVLRQTAPTPELSCPAKGDASVHDLPTDEHQDEHGASSVEHPVAAAIACLALVSLASSSAERTQRCFEQGALAAVVDAMLLQPHAKLLQLNGCMALVHLVRAGGSSLPDDVRCQAAARAGAATALTAALVNHASYWATLTWAILAVLLITNSSALRALETINAGGRAALEHAAATLKDADGVEGQGFGVTTDGFTDGAGRLHIPVHSAVSLKSILTLIDLARAWLDLSAEAFASAKSRNVPGDEMLRPAVPGEEFLCVSA